MVDQVTELMDKLHVLVVGPGLGRCPLVLEATARILGEAQSRNIPLVLDADALWLLTLKPRILLSSTSTSPIVLTPNAMERKRLDGVEENSWSSNSNCIVIEKGKEDVINALSSSLICGEDGGSKRSGGLGDILAGTVGTLVAWNGILAQQQGTNTSSEDLPLACWTACCFVKRATHRAFEEHRRSMTAPDVLAALGPTVNEMTELEIEAEEFC
jgi:ATP-dependent NAD(P)H-hydrate dehydratase